MKIAIDLTPLPNQKTGVGQYAKALIFALADQDRKNHYLVFIRKSQAADFDPKKSNFLIVSCAEFLRFRILRIAWEQIILPLRLEFRRADILHSLHYTTPLIGRFGRVVTFHDMTFFLFPEKHTPVKKFFFRLMIPLSAKICDRIIAVSQSTKNDIQKILGVGQKKIDVVYETINPLFSPKKNEAAAIGVKTKYGIKNKFILYAGTLEPRKNVDGLIKAYSTIVGGTDCQLVIAGKKGWAYQSIFMTVKNLALERKIIFTDYVPDQDLAVLYNAAEIFVYPSFYEGFGIPPLEAMACGVPTITSNISSMPEVAGDGALLVDPNNSGDLSRAMRELLANESLRAKLVKNGLKRAAFFSRKKLADDMIIVYGKTMSARRLENKSI